jgi:hypothetical protein
MLWRHHVTLIPLLFLCSIVAAAGVSLISIIGKTLLVIGGGKPHRLAVGETSAMGVKLIGINGDAAIIESGGKRETGRGSRRASEASSPPVRKALCYSPSMGDSFLPTAPPMASACAFRSIPTLRLSP